MTFGLHRAVGNDVCVFLVCGRMKAGHTTSIDVATRILTVALDLGFIQRLPIDAQDRAGNR